MIDALFPPVQKDSPSDIQSIYDQRAPPRQGKVLTYA
ncbi:DNA-binding protein [Streptococcus pneumoniae]|nr:DNA-binding protein [Streptococcus pneumoniae 13856]KXV80766.1 DNA-binding protein [Streptococcus pneumoniae]KXV91779.1 DNA-binding protein [Streptococcus pneumoniae]KXW03875.1 DNA-binding protein [Streptococcus pneumoniae]KXW10279.1 DNA-binding protein [Streptococcus pneumoniae]